MTAAGISPRVAVAVGLAALLPVFAYGIDRSLDAGLLAAINVLLLMGVLYLAFGPPADGHQHASA